MTDPTIAFLKRLRGVSLSANERLAMRERLTAYADMHPVFALAATPAAGFFAIFSSRAMGVYATALALLLVVGTGVTFAAEGSVPGDSLYLLKIHVNEPVMTALAPTATGQARLAATLATRRVNEAVTLASRGTLTPERQTYLKEEFAAGVERTKDKTDALASRGNAAQAETVRANFAADLAGEAQALGAVASKNHTESSDLLTAVVATSEGIASDAEGPDLAIADEETAGTEEAATGTEPVAVAEATEPAPETHPALMAARIAPAVTMEATGTASTTPAPAAQKAFPSAFSRQLHVSASTFEHRFGSTTLRIPFFAPKLDIAIPGAAGSETDTAAIGE